MKIVSIIGARPNFVKCSPLSREITKKFDEVVIHTGQHYDYEMNKIFFNELNIPEPEYHLDIGSGTHGEQTGEMLKGIEAVLIKEMPDMVLVYGDTNSTIAGALAASKLHITIGHIEAGLRSFDKKMPEEINRVLTDHCSDILFCPTETAVKNLKNEGITEGVYLTGDVMVDVLKENIKIAEKKSTILDELDLKSKEYYLSTLHRAENTDNVEKMKNIVDAFCEIENLIFPCHPRTEKCLKEFGLWDRLKENVKIVKPVGYLDMLILEKNANKILTDSGGVQKEAYILKVPCITLRENTEWVETVEDGWNVLVGADKEDIIEAMDEFMPEGGQRNVFGNGDASERIVEIIGRRVYENGRNGYRVRE
ncbi:MAG: UDP-N-acetylglucosamine 2-epimerase (non-hydrolyzing) [Methanosarcinaceae archaeon]|nr:UDP-N-acetylglucosamine 2-epimerase (non-hydrolyzing) [Methanosarcinaceae archaeon]NKQ39039.1 UDP-N-acetylglucosamine 2-epimerase (non-hydrolyzing) [Methanosarcinales archaeon]